ncbi:MAG: NFACT RNA binding domain-containing protein [Thermoplasmata archaeon]
MKGTITFAELYSIASFLSRYRGGYVEKNYRSEDSFSFKFRKSGVNSVYLHFMEGKFLFLDEENRIDGKKNSLPLENSPISDVKQIGTDRILFVDGPKPLVIEMMGGGNIFILSGRTIEFCRKEVRRKGRVLRKGEEYEFPDYLDVRAETFDAEWEIKSSSGDPVRTLAVKLGLSKYAPEILCALHKDVGSNEDLISNIQEIKKLIEKIFSSASEGKIFVYRDEFYVWRSFCRKEEPEELDIVKGLAKMYFESEEGESKAEAVQRSVERMREEMERLRKTGEYIVEHLAEFDSLLSSVKDFDTRYKVDFDKGTISFREDGMDIVLKMGKTAGENANEYFDASKRIRERLSRVRIQEEKKVKERKEVRRVFSKYRWFLNSDGNLVLAGKDAETNDSVVKKYLGDKDLYFHADIHGAPSVVMKVTFPVTEIGIEETAEFAWCMSKAWSAKLGNGSVFYVTRSQVSKTPESGEYLARGAWVIRGKKSYVSHLSLELAVGFQKYENREYVVAAPPSSIKGKKVLIRPGEGKESEVSEIANFLGVEKEAVFPVLPPGGIVISGKVEDQ